MKLFSKLVLGKQDMLWQLHFGWLFPNIDKVNTISDKPACSRCNSYCLCDTNISRVKKKKLYPNIRTSLCIFVPRNGVLRWLVTNWTQKEREQTPRLVPDTGVPTCVALRKYLETNIDQWINFAAYTWSHYCSCWKTGGWHSVTEKFRRQIQMQ